MDQEVTTTPEQEQSQQPPSAVSPELNLNDLASLRSILEVASSRGAFKAAELEAVGKAYNKLNTFLESVATKKE
jgi:hypothetical protein